MPRSVSARALRRTAVAAAALAVVAPLSAAAVAAPATSQDVAAPAVAERAGKPVVRPTVVGHRGASGYRPEHTLAAYELAAAQGADVIEPDLVSTKDGVLVVRHENLITDTTDVADRPEFADRKTTKTVDGKELTGWFTEDFTLDELKTLRAKERLPEARPESASYDGMFEVPTFAEVLELRERLSAEHGRTIGVIPEIKHPTYFDSIGLSMEEAVVELLEAHRLNKRNAPVSVQSFELANLRDLNESLGLKAETVFLSGVNGAPYDSVAAGDALRDYDYYETAVGMREVRAAGVDTLGPALGQIITKEEDGSMGEETAFVSLAHRTGLEVVPYTFRAENQFLYQEFRSSTDPNEIGDMVGMIQPFLDAGIDGLFTDHPDLGVQAVDTWMQGKKEHPGKGVGKGAKRGLKVR
ncbi:glycerophosphodiester phosphodiesterase [Micrococcus lylae]|uniref:glycerophosphodiester phosphodiesterase family protein n=1 Tax=Micrococcus lylae TaxID=1273 RepID=UPI0021A42E73|nr:glycerophosphodiester phosphodiesterase family protein [Micrococcus lylae]MCT2008418.1 glycerophosphodiester phosphodiesterase [Micrococcus lylae]MCT2070398.1 glycerophosphodiester phosphodiesterase [Micrococcus lylae]